MKKKLMMVAVLLGALTLGACVDDNESASVTAVRDAKAEQLKSVAALNNAQAEAELIKANAEKALKEAQAAYQQAQADATKETTEYNKQKYALELEKIKAEYEKLIAQYKADATKYEKDIWDNADSYVKDVYGKYTTALAKINSINQQLIEQNLLMAQIDIDEIQAKAALESFLYEKNQIILQKTLEISRLEALKTADKAEVDKQISEMVANAYNLVKNEKPAVEKVQKEALNAYEAIYNPIDIYYGQDLNEDHKVMEWEAALLPYLKAWQYLQKLQQDGVNDSYPYFTSNSLNKVEIEGCPNVKYLTFYTITTSGEFLNATNSYNDYFSDEVTRLEEALGTPSVKDGAAATGLYVELEAAQGEVKDAEDKLAAELKKPAAEQDKNAIAGWKTIIEKSGPQRIAYAEDAITAQKEKIEGAKEDLKEFKDAIAMVQDAEAIAGYEKVFAAAEEAAKTYLQATHEVHKVQNAIDLIGINSFDNDGTPNSLGYDPNGEYGKLLSVKNGIVDVESLILECKEDIAEAEAAIKAGGNQDWVTVTEAAQYYVYDARTGNYITSGYGKVEIYKYQLSMSTEEQKGIIQAEIDVLNAKLKVQQTLVEQYKAKLDAMLAAE